jgi:hypothetical protein
MFPIHGRFPTQMAIIGRLLVDYAELELDLMNCVQVARQCDLNSTLKAMFRVRGETSRIDIADGLGRSPYFAVGLTAEFDAMIQALRYCLRIRNKYAHAYWHDPNQGTELCYVSLEELAREDDEVRDLAALTFFFVDEPLLLQQEQFFEYTRSLLTYLNYEGRFRSGALRQRIFPLLAQKRPRQRFEAQGRLPRVSPIALARSRDGWHRPRMATGLRCR